MDKHKLIRPKPKRELMVFIRVFNLPKFTENKKLDLVFGFINVDCSAATRLPRVNWISSVGGVRISSSYSRTISHIDLEVLFDERADRIGLTGRVGCHLLGDDIDAVVVTLAG